QKSLRGGRLVGIKGRCPVGLSREEKRDGRRLHDPAGKRSLKLAGADLRLRAALVFSWQLHSPFGYNLGHRLRRFISNTPRISLRIQLQ
ncbi:hypothetical protein ACSLNH_07595, partial [Comamonas kerstersii]|uniref:hypothetical protein n=1 Tax=Comamonas kerstersii TaxID=225992 RepID=UPI003EDEF06A